MKSRKQVFFIAFLAIIFGVGLLGYSWQQNKISANFFDTSGYILVADQDTEVKQRIFPTGTEWKEALGDMIAFTDAVGDKIEIVRECFIHYDDSSLASMTDGVVVDLADISSAQLTNHYAISPEISFENNGSSYQLGNTTSEYVFSDFVWKISESKYMLVSDNISITFAEDDVREAENFIEFTYIDEGIVQIQTEENMWQTASSECSATAASGEVIDFFMKNVQNGNGDVLMDLSKITLGSEDNIEVTPLSEDLLSIAETVIPKFNITAEAGQDGTGGGDGDGGDNGLSSPAGENGAAGTSGTNGSAGSAGSSGSDGSDGSGAQIDSDILNFPIFTLVDWTVGATSCSATITVEDVDGMLISNSEELASSIFLYDMEAGMIAQYAPDEYTFYTLDADGYYFEFTNLSPDHNYRLVVSAPLNTNTDESEDYLRDFVSKTFWTDSIGVFMEVGDVTETTAEIDVTKQSYASEDLTSAQVFVYTALDSAMAATASYVSADYSKSYELSFTSSGTETVTVDATGLTSDTTYYARVRTSSSDGTQLMPSQVLTITTLKERAVIGNPIITANRYSWGFDLVPGTVYDVDNGITKYTYEFYYAADINSDGELASSSISPVKTVTASDNSSLVVPIDGTYLVAGYSYVVRTIATFYDNEKSYEIVSGFSNTGTVTGSQLPTIYFTNSADFDTTIPDTASSLSDYYDQIFGTLTVSPGTEGSRILVSGTFIPTITIRASGYYYVQYPVFTADNAPTDGTEYLLATEHTGGYVTIDIPAKALSAATVDTDGAVNGLRPDTQYQVILKADLSDDGINATDYDVSVGVVTVETPDTVALQAEWDESGDTTAASTAFVRTLSLDNSVDEETTDSQYARQMNNLQTVTLKMIDGSISNPGSTIATLVITEDNFDDIATINSDDAETLGELMVNGLVITEETFGFDADEMADNDYTVVHLEISSVTDYTAISTNRVNQMAYVAEDKNDGDEIESSSSDGAVYTNVFDVLDYQHEIKLSGTVDSIPDPEDGLIVTAYDTDQSGVNDTYEMVANYANRNKLATTITYYAFDYPDFHKDYSTDTENWSMDKTWLANLEQSRLTAVTVVDNEYNGPWLSRITVTVPASGVMPTVKFIPQTAENYYNDQYPTDSGLAESMTDAYSAGTTMEDGVYIFFLNSNNADAEETGHQFVFAWTMEYQLEDDTVSKYYYPFNATDYIDYESVPHSAPEDQPRHEPTIYAIPWTSSASSDTWAVYVVDPDNALLTVTDNEGNLKVPVYKQTSLVTGTNFGDTQTTIYANVYDTEPADLTEILGTDSKNLVTVPRVGDDVTGSLAASVRVQWYIDKYTTSGTGIYSDGAEGSNATGYTTATAEHSNYSSKAASGDYILPYYTNAFKLYLNDTSTYRDSFSTSDISATISEVAVDNDNRAVSSYSVRVTGISSTLADVNGVRLTFENADGVELLNIDKYLESIDSARITENDDGTLTLSFTVSLSTDLGSIQGETVFVSMSLLYETGDSGYQAAQLGATVSLASYSVIYDDIDKLSPSGRYIFGSTGTLMNRTSSSSSMPKVGSFFTLSSISDSGMTVTSTRNSSLISRQANVSYDLTLGAGAFSSSLSLIPITLAESNEIEDITAYDVDGDEMSTGDLNITIATATPIIAYTDTTYTSNSVSSTYSVNTSAEVYFMIRQQTDSGSYNVLVQNEDGSWSVYDYASAGYANHTAVFVSPNEDVLMSSSGSYFDFANLDPDSTFTINAYYKDSDGNYQLLNMLNSSGTEITNFLTVTTYSRPVISMSTNYYVSNYYYKYFRNYLKIEQVLNYYYTLALYDELGNFISYVEAGTGASEALTKYTRYDVGYAEYILEYDSSSAYRYVGGFTYSDSISYNSETSEYELSGEGSRVYLDQGSEYYLQIDVYNASEGPAYEGGSTADNLMIDVTTGAPVDDAISWFTTTAVDSEINISGSYNLVSDTPTITFSPTIVTNSANVRDNRYAAVVVRDRVVDGEIVRVDVSEDVTINGEAMSMTAALNITSNSKLVLTDTDGDDDSGLFQAGDQFTCYIYAIYDEFWYTSTYGSNAGIPTRDEIIAGRVISPDYESADVTEYELTEASIDFESYTNEDGDTKVYATSELNYPMTVTYTTAQTSAGTVSVSMVDGSFVFSLENPVNQSEITHAVWSVTANYTDEAGESGSVSVTSGSDDDEHARVSLAQVSTNTYTYTIIPSFSSIPEDATILNYIVSLQFYEATDYDDDGNATGYDSSDISMSAGSGCSVGSNDGGTRLSTVIVFAEEEEEDLGIVATMLEAIMPEEEVEEEEVEETPEVETTPEVEETPEVEVEEEEVEATPEPSPTIDVEDEEEEVEATPEPTATPEAEVEDEEEVEATPTPEVTPEATPEPTPEPEAEEEEEAAPEPEVSETPSEVISDSEE